MIADIFTFCRSAAIEDDGGLLIRGGFNCLGCKEFPTPPLSLTIIARVISTIDEDGEHPASIAFVGPDGETVFEHPEIFQVSTQNAQDQAYNVLVIPVNGVMFEAPNDFDVQLNIDGQTIARTTLSVQL